MFLLLEFYVISVVLQAMDILKTQAQPDYEVPDSTCATKYRTKTNVLKASATCLLIKRLDYRVPRELVGAVTNTMIVICALAG